ncbi:DNA polymerase IV [Alicyclobacillus dauci]|uniref:DNA polymerase IV n=1 Tax=Alicyclobacillus dauci TaxID=1475485 RepID=A0ABY6Z4X2_9BACL|nr:DNA polymerase IV [Alicyclobacillus dauci]WAH37928.1 DNA polymerase IV [Alicyclobacillus dauci]
MTEGRRILHIDMNAFYASCHAAEEPDKYAGRPTAVAGSPETRHGIIVTASYEARAKGVETTMTVMQAKRICPDLLFIQPDFALYRTYARKVFDIVGQFTPLVEVVSIDECYADVTGSRLFGTGIEIAKAIQKTIRDELRLPCSIGVADCKFFAKMGSNLKKPMGISIVDKSNFREILWPMNVSDMHGVGEKTAAKLHSLGIRTIRQLAEGNDRTIERAFGLRGLELKAYANGRDDRPVTAERAPAKSIGHSITLPQDAKSFEALQRVLLNLADQVGRRTRKHGVVGRVLTLTIRYANLETFTRRITLPVHTDLTEHIYQTAQSLLQSNWREGHAIRLVGITLSEFQQKNPTSSMSVQTSLFNAPEEEAKFTLTKRLEKLTAVTDALRNRFGEDIVVRGRMLQPDDSNALRNHRSRGTSLQTDQLYDKE